LRRRLRLRFQGVGLLFELVVQRRRLGIGDTRQFGGHVDILISLGTAQLLGVGRFHYRRERHRYRFARDWDRRLRHIGPSASTLFASPPAASAPSPAPPLAVSATVAFGKRRCCFAVGCACRNR
jgi:hypothetical protein